MARSPYCEPCGECQRCFGDALAHVNAKRYRRALKQALRQINRLIGAVEDEVSSYGPDEVKQHPTVAEHQACAQRARKTAARLTALLHGKAA